MGILTYIINTKKSYYYHNTENVTPMLNEQFNTCTMAAMHQYDHLPSQ